MECRGARQLFSASLSSGVASWRIVACSRASTRACPFVHIARVLRAATPLRQHRRTARSRLASSDRTGGSPTCEQNTYGLDVRPLSLLTYYQLPHSHICASRIQHSRICCGRSTGRNSVHWPEAHGTAVLNWCHSLLGLSGSELMPSYISGPPDSGQDDRPRFPRVRHQFGARHRRWQKRTNALTDVPHH